MKLNLRERAERWIKCLPLRMAWPTDAKHLESEFVAARNEALEDAAAVCDRRAHSRGKGLINVEAHNLAIEIRSLIVTAPLSSRGDDKPQGGGE